MKPANEVPASTLKRKHRPRFRRSPPEDRTEDGIVFASKVELKRYRELKVSRAAGAIKWFIRQPMFDLMGAKYTADFLIVGTHGTVSVEEVKPSNISPRFRDEALRRWRRNAKQVKAVYGVDVKLVEIEA